MAKSTRALTGAAKNAYLKRTLRDEADIPEAARERLTGRLQGEIASVSLRAAAIADEPVAIETDELASLPAAPVGYVSRTAIAVAGIIEAASCPEPPAFDPYSPNVIVVIRTRGREAVLVQLAAIIEIEHLRLLAREQQLGIAADLATADEIRLAIVAAAERRIANRRAAAS